MFVTHGIGWRAEVYVLLYVDLEEADVILKSFICICRTDPLATVPIREFTSIISEALGVIFPKGTLWLALTMFSLNFSTASGSNFLNFNFLDGDHKK